MVNPASASNTAARIPVHCSPWPVSRVARRDAQRLAFVQVMIVRRVIDLGHVEIGPRGVRQGLGQGRPQTSDEPRRLASLAGMMTAHPSTAPTSTRPPAATSMKAKAQPAAPRGWRRLPTACSPSPSPCRSSTSLLPEPRRPGALLGSRPARLSPSYRRLRARLGGDRPLLGPPSFFGRNLSHDRPLVPDRHRLFLTADRLHRFPGAGVRRASVRRRGAPGGELILGRGRCALLAGPGCSNGPSGACPRPSRSPARARLRPAPQPPLLGARARSTLLAVALVFWCAGRSALHFGACTAVMIHPPETPRYRYRSADRRRRKLSPG